MQIKNTTRLYWLDGIKGISCLFIFIHHFVLEYFPAAHFGKEKESLLNGFDTFLASRPFLGIIVDGNFFVHLFIIISGYVITWQILKLENKKIGVFTLKRYIKLIFPLAVCAIINFIPSFIDKIQNSAGVEAIIKEAYKYLRSLFIGILFFGDTYFYGPFWMLNYIFIGGIFVSIITSLVWALDEKKSIFIPCAIILALYLSHSEKNIIWASSLLGCVLCLFNTFYKVKFGKALFLLVPVALFFGSYPTVAPPQNIFKFFTFPFASELSASYWHSIAAFLFILYMSNSVGAQNLFSKIFFQKLGQISLWIYVLHMNAISWTDKILKVAGFPIQKGSEGYIFNCALCFIMSSVILISLSLAAAKFISPFSNKTAEKILKSLSQKNSQNSEN
ncbi:MAG: acyltransferase family protein [Treponema sp.]|nr:acyltransferase family protein [Treponema sp.]